MTDHRPRSSYESDWLPYTKVTGRIAVRAAIGEALGGGGWGGGEGGRRGGRKEGGGKVVDDPATRLVAEKIIALSQHGVCGVATLHAMAVKEFKSE